ncbi:hypothetical protein F4779DRAFT_601292 [Xylariaceae sp. FL0662B]|nr:hypothetical protein F4779DRAFT_601292 [Xylariaceae sp. FL0662B]
MTVRSTLLVALLAISQTLAQDAEVDVPDGLATRRLPRDVYGYSIEPVWLDAYISTPLATNLLSIIANITGKPPPIRVGGNTADQTYQINTLSTGNDSVALPDPLHATQFNVTPNWYQTWSDYFPEDTDLIFTLNLAVNNSAWENAVAQAEAVHTALGEKLVMFELGNEIDHFINKGWRDETWGTKTYIEQFRNLTGQIVGSAWYKAAENPPKFQAGVFGDPPEVPDQQDEIDDFSIANLTENGVGGIIEREKDRNIIGSYAVHLYPQSSCDTERWLRMRLDLLSDHSVLWKNVSQFAPHVAAADKAGAPLVMGETNSVSCSGKSGISDTFGAALWGVDYVLAGASIGIAKTYFHLGAQSEYSAFTPGPYEIQNETVAGGIRANWYGHYFAAKVAAARDGEDLTIAALPSVNSSTLSGYAVYAGETERRSLRKLVFLDMGVWNGTEGLSNPSTLSVTDGKAFSEGERPRGVLRVSTPWCAGQNVTVTRLTAPGTNAKSNVTVSGVTFDMKTGNKIGKEIEEALTVGENGAVEVAIVRAEAVLLEVASGNSSECSAHEQNPVTSGSNRRLKTVWSSLLVTTLISTCIFLL